MIKVIAFDMVGVLVTEKDINLSPEEDKLERLFGDNIDDADYLTKARKIVPEDSVVIRMTEDIIEKLYKVKDLKIFEKIKTKYNDVKIIIATNHVSFARNYIDKHLDTNYLDDVIISAEVHKLKPNADFYQLLLDKYNVNPDEMLFVDDSQKNVDGAKELGIKTIKIDKDMDVYNEVSLHLDDRPSRISER